MKDAKWPTCANPAEMVESLCSTHRAARTKVGRRKLLLLCCGSIRLIWDVVKLDISRAAVEARERFADGLITEDEMKAIATECLTARFKIRYGVGDDEDHAVGYATMARLTEPEIQRCLMYARGARYAADRTDNKDRYAPIVNTSPEFQTARRMQCNLIREIFGNPFRQTTFAFDPAWRTDTVRSLATGIYESRDFSPLPILADALQDAGCDNADLLNHCRGTPPPRPFGVAEPDEPTPGPHFRGCWALDIVLDKA